MAYLPFISKDKSYSITDLHTYDSCSFKFYVYHHLDRKYELEEGSAQMALGGVLDEAIKKVHYAKRYDFLEAEYESYIMAAVTYIKETVARSNGKPSYFSGMLPFIDQALIDQATEVFRTYLRGKGWKVNSSLGKVDFCKYPIKIKDEDFQLWGLPDAYEMGEDGVVEVVDYKSRTNIEKGKEWMDMLLMPKIYVLLCCDTLLRMGYKKARFVVRFWQDPLDETFCEEFDLEKMSEHEQTFKKLIEDILDNKEISFCEKPFCKACKSPKRDQFLLELEKDGLVAAVVLNELSKEVDPAIQTG